MDNYDDHTPHGAAPVRKVTAAGVGGAAATVAVIVLQMATGTEVPVGLEGALATLFAFVAGYITPAH